MTASTEREPTFYDRMYSDALDCEEGYERKWSPRGIRNFSQAAYLASQPERDDHAGFMWREAMLDADEEGRPYSLIPLKRAQSLNAAFDAAVRDYKAGRTNLKPVVVSEVAEAA